MGRSRLVVLVLSVLGSTFLAGGPAAAHTGFEGSDPADGALIDAAVHAIVIEFTAEAAPVGEGFVVLDPSGVIRTPDTITSDAERKSWILGFDPPLVDGVVGVRWTVQAPDAHPISGAFRFTVGSGVVGGSLASGEADSGLSLGAEASPGRATVQSGRPTPQDSSGGELGPAAPAAEDPAGSSDPAAVDPASPAADDPASPAAVDPADRAAGDPSASSGERSGTASSETALQAFLADTGPGVTRASGLRIVGRLVGFLGALLAIGGLAFAAGVVQHHRRDVRTVVAGGRVAALAVVVGTVVDLVAHLAIINGGWLQALATDGLRSTATSAYGAAVTLRIGAGLLLFTGAGGSHRRPVTAPIEAGPRALALVGPPGGAPPSVDSSTPVARSGLTGPPRPSEPHVPSPDRPPAAPTSEHRRMAPPLGLRGGAIGAGLVVLLASFTLDGHTVTEGNRLVTAAVDMVHVAAASVWAGGVAAFALVLWRRRRRGEALDGLDLALRFSVIAGAALAVAGVAGVALATIVLDSVPQLWTTPWGRLLVAKTVAVAAASGLGAYNHFVVIPWMQAHPDDDHGSARIRTTVTAEALLLAVVVLVTAFLVGASSQG